jgi:hypothetical protein
VLSLEERVAEEAGGAHHRDEIRRTHGRVFGVGDEGVVDEGDGGENGGETFPVLGRTLVWFA